MTTQTRTFEESREIRAHERLGMVLQEKWTLQAVLGIGGMASVYAATHRNGKRVAVKILHAELGHDEELRRRFLHEGYAANTIQHEGAVSVLDDDVAPDGSAFIVMELLEGETIERRWERCGRALPPTEVLAIVDQLLDVLAAAHGKNVVHRDIKPENLFLTKSGVLKVLDFGIARVHEGQQARKSSTRVGIVMGTPAFMAPEQARGRWNDVDSRTDLWAVGATMYTLLTGHYVHEAESPNEQLILSATMQAAPLAATAGQVPDQVAAIVDRALAFEKELRWPDAVTMQFAVRSASHDLGGGSLPASSPNPSTGAETMAGGPVPGMATFVQPLATTAIDTTGKTSAVVAWTKERKLRVSEVARLRAGVAGLQHSHAVAKKRTIEAQARVELGRAERRQLDQWFRQKVGTRTAAVEDARLQMRRQLVAIARRALADGAAFGTEFDDAREQIAKLERVAESAARDVRVHEMAIGAFDRRSVRQGLALLGIALILLLAAIVAPIVWRATRVVAPQTPSATDPAKHRP
jgi:serine/threonine protein kinase